MDNKQTMLIQPKDYKILDKSEFNSKKQQMSAMTLATVEIPNEPEIIYFIELLKEYTNKDIPQKMEQDIMNIVDFHSAHQYDKKNITIYHMLKKA